MELDVHLSRVGDEAWGFRLIGGVDFGMPLTVVKVLKNSPAEKAGLQNGDTVSRINDSVADSMSHDDSRRAVAAATDYLSLGVIRGLYDPVLDDYEEILEPIDQDDFDQPSRPTEVQFEPKDFTDLPQIGDLPEFLETAKLSESRSLTASPFVLPTKPYRPFSTEPLNEIPILEDPIILNPDYHDVFSKLGIDEDFLPKTRFKLPISEQYDPDGTKKVKKGIQTEDKDQIILQDSNTGISKENVRPPCTVTEMKEEIMTKEDMKFMKQMKQEIDLENIELTANSIVNESIVKALTVAEEIKKEIDIELVDSSTSVSKLMKESTQSNIDSIEKQESVALISEIIKENIQKESMIVKKSNEVNELASLIDQTTEEIIQHNEVNVAKEIENFEAISKQKQSNVEKKSSTKQEIEEIIETGSVKKKSTAFDKDSESKSLLEKKDAQSISVEEYKTKEAKVIEKDIQQQVTKTQANDKTLSSVNSGENKTSSQTKISTSTLLAEQRAYTIGLQTIPHIKGTIHSSYHYDLLLKTFFIHLTDVMVALSRFILSEPVLTKSKTSKECENVNKTTEQKETKTVSADIERKEVEADKIIKQNIEKEVREKRKEGTVIQKAKDHEINKDVTNEEYKTNKEVEEVVEKQILSGSQMAQLSEKKSEDLTHRMDAVITEFQTKAGIDETIEVRDRRSRSRSKIEEEVMQESDPLEWLAKVDSKKKVQEIALVEKSSEFSSSNVSESLAKTKVESRHESSEVKSKPEKSKPTYIAIVESHVYTNKDAILDEKTAEISETTNVQSFEKSEKAAEIISTGQVISKSLQVEEKVAKAIVENSQESSTINSVKSAQIVQNADLISQNITEDVKNFEKETIDANIDIKKHTEEKEEHVLQQIVEPVVEVQEMLSTVGETVVKEQSIAVEIKDEHQESVVKQEMTTTILAKRPTSLELKHKEDTHIVKKKLELELNHDEDPHIVKKKMEIEESNTKSIKMESDTTSINEVDFKSKKGEITQEKVTVEERFTEESHVTESTEATQLSLNTQTLVIDSNSYQSSMSKTQETILCQQDQEATFIAKSIESSERSIQEPALNIDIGQEKQLTSQTSIQSDEKNDIDTPTPTSVPSPLTDEYMFKLQIALPKGITPVPPDLSPEAKENLRINKNNLIAHIDATIEQGIVYDPPLPTPPGSKVTSPVYTKPGLRGGADKQEYSKEEILEIERKSSLLASAIDETIKSIEEYKEEVGIETKTKRTTNQNNGVMYNGYSKVVETKVFNNIEDTNDKMVEECTKTDHQIGNKNSAVAEQIKNGVNTTLDIKTTDNQSTNMTTFTAVDSVMNTIGSEPIDTNGKKNTLEGYRPVQFNVEEIQSALQSLRSAYLTSNSQESALKQAVRQMYKTEDGEMLGTIQGIVDGLEDAVVNNEFAKELGKPGMTEDKIAELISGESEMLREAHVMGLSRVLTSHMHRANDDSSVDFQKIKPIIDSLRDSEVLKALNEELIRAQEERKKKEEKKWTTFLQKPKRPVPRVKFGYHGYVDVEEDVQTPYKVKIVKQPKPKVAPDYKPQDFNTGLLPWEERALREPTPPPVEAEDPILIPEEVPEILEAVDPLPESEVPDLEDSGIPLPPPKLKEETEEVPEEVIEEEELDLEAIVEETEKIVEENLVEEMDQSRIAEQLMASVQNMVDPNASLEQQLAQMRAQLAALAQLPCVIQQSLELVTRQLSQLSQVETQTHSHAEVTEVKEETEEAVTQKNCVTEEVTEDIQQSTIEENNTEEVTEETMQEVKQTIETEVLERMRREEEEMLDEQRRIEKQKKELMEQMKQEQEARQLKQRPTPRVGKPRPAFGPITPQERPLVLPGGRKWRKPQDAYNEQFIAETLAAQAEMLQGKTKGLSYESVLLPYDERINFMKYEKPPVSLDHLKDSDVYKLIHNMEQTPGKRVEMLTSVVAEADYREKCRSVTPSTQRLALEEQVQP